MSSNAFYEAHSVTSLDSTKLLWHTYKLGLCSCKLSFAPGLIPVISGSNLFNTLIKYNTVFLALPVNRRQPFPKLSSNWAPKKLKNIFSYTFILEAISLLVYKIPKANRQDSPYDLHLFHGRCTVLCKTCNTSILCLRVPKILLAFWVPGPSWLRYPAQSPCNAVFLISHCPVLPLAWQSLASVQNLFLCGSLLVKPFFT